ncbi:MAG: PAS domain-containing protein [Bacteroidetes bacterium]|nr:PAS domain-containing protein [Bacteroidota bacterium]
MGSFEDEIIISPYSGKPFFALMKISMFIFEGIKYHILKLTDLTLIKDKEQKLIEHEELFKYVTLATQDGIYQYDLKNNTTWVNDEYIKMLGYSKDASNHDIQWFLDKIHPQDKDFVKTNLEELRKGNITNLNLEYRFKHKLGHYLYLIDRGFVIRDHENKLSKIIGAMTDVSRLRENEEKLIESEKKLNNILDTLDETVFSFTFFGIAK